jgi:hypothetical protein
MNKKSYVCQTAGGAAHSLVHFLAGQQVDWEARNKKIEEGKFRT